MSNEIRLRGFFLIICATFLWGCSAILAKYLISKNFEPLIIVQMRVSFSAVIIFLYLYFFDKVKLKIEASDIKLFAFVGVCGIAGSNFFYYYSFKYISASLAILIQYTAPIFVVIYALFFHNEKLTSRKIISLFLSLFGIFLAVEAYRPETITANLTGVLYVTVAAISFAIFNIGSKKLLNKYNSVTVLFYSLFFASIFWLIVNNPIEILNKNYSTFHWQMYFLIAIFSILLPYGAYTFGLKDVSTTEAVITSTAEPIFTILLEFIILGNLLGPLQIVGGVVVLVAILILQLEK